MSINTSPSALPTVGIAAIFKNEGPYILEWIAACRVHGAHRIYIADNNSTDGSTELLAELHRAGEIVHLPFPGEEGKPPQLSAYREIMARHGAEVDWMAFIDADEFFAFADSSDNLPALIARVGAPSDVGAIAVNWALFGSSGHSRHDDAPVLERFTQRADSTDTNNLHYKSIVRCKAYASTHGTPHMFSVSQGYRYVHANGASLTDHPQRGVGLSADLVWTPLRLNHYVVKSREEFDWKKRPNGSATTVGRIKGDAYFSLHDRNEVHDPLESASLQRVQEHMKKLTASLPRKLLDAVSFKNTPPPPVRQETPISGHVDRVNLVGRQLTVIGWSPLVHAAELPKICIEWPGGSALSESLTKRARPDVIKRNASAGLHCGFSAEFQLPDVSKLRADPAACVFWAMSDKHKERIISPGIAPWTIDGESIPAARPPTTSDQPAMPALCIELLATALASSRSYLEYGSGGSTMLAVRSKVARIVSVESDAAWLKGVIDKAHAVPGAKERLHAMHIDIGPTKALGYPVDDSRWKSFWRYPMAPWAQCKTLGLEPDLVLIDGRFRLACFLASLLNAPAGCRILFDDYTDRPHYHSAATFVRPLTQVDRMAVFVVPPQRPEATDIAHALAAAMSDAR